MALSHKGLRLPLGRVVIINDSFAAHGGAEDVAVQEALALKALGVPILLMTGDNTAHPALKGVEIDVLALRERPIIEMSAVRGGLRGLFNTRAARTLSEWIRQNDTPDTLYHLHNWSHILSPSIFYALKSVRGRLVMSIHDYFIACPNGGYLIYKTAKICMLTPLSVKCISTDCDRRNYSHKLWRVIRQAIRRFLFNLKTPGPVLLTVHEGMIPYLLRADIPKEIVGTLRNPIRPFTRERVAAENNDTIVFVGRLDQEKGPEMAAKAGRLAGVKMRFIGDGPMRAQLERDYPEFEFTGRRTRAEIADLVSDARALVMPSLFPEPFGMVAVEACWSGLPVILTAEALLAPEIVAAGAGLSYDSRDVTALAGHMTRLMQDRDATERMSREAFSALPHLGNTPEQWLEKLLSVFTARLTPSDEAAA
jgi:glycosyltransferase involved in cell wall biosynthesis